VVKILSAQDNKKANESAENFNPEVYKHLFEFGKRLLSDLEVENLLAKAMDHLIELSNAERGMLIVFDEDKNIIFETARNLNKKDIEKPKFEVSRTIINKVKNERILSIKQGN